MRPPTKLLPLAAVMASWLLAAGAANAQSYLCVSEMAAGLQFDSVQKSWRSNVFTATSKFVVKRATSDEARVGWKWAVWALGRDSLPNFVCTEEFTGDGFLYCQGFGQFTMNRKNLRFISSYMTGFVDDGLSNPSRTEGGDTPSVNGGRCSPV